MLRWNRPDFLWSSVVLLSIFTPWVVADDAPGGRVMLKKRPAVRQASAEEKPAVEESSGKVVLKKRAYIRQVSAEDKPTEDKNADKEAAKARWDEIKSRYRAEQPAPAAAADRAPARTAPVLPIPDDGEEESDAEAIATEVPATEEPPAEEFVTEESTTEEPTSEEEETATEPTPLAEGADPSAKEPMPITGFEEEPAWILGTRPIPTDADDDEANQEGTAQVAAQSDEELEAAPELQDSEEDEAKEEKDDKPLSSPVDTDPDAPKHPRKGNRRPRAINEISPAYDKTIDEDIRKFAKEQAELYGVSLHHGPFPTRHFPDVVFQWEPTNFYYYPLYFEDPQLERYGHTYGDCLQPVASLARFGAQLVMLPYQMTLDPICTPKYALGWYRPGEVAPKLHYQVPLNAQAAAVEAGVITGLFFAIP